MSESQVADASMALMERGTAPPGVLPPTGQPTQSGPHLVVFILHLLHLQEPQLTLNRFQLGLITLKSILPGQVVAKLDVLV